MNRGLVRPVVGRHRGGRVSGRGIGQGIGHPVLAGRNSSLRVTCGHLGRGLESDTLSVVTGDGERTGSSHDRAVERRELEEGRTSLCHVVLGADLRLPVDLQVVDLGHIQQDRLGRRYTLGHVGVRLAVRRRGGSGRRNRTRNSRLGLSFGLSVRFGIRLRSSLDSELEVDVQSCLVGSDLRVGLSLSLGLALGGCPCVRLSVTTCGSRCGCLGTTLSREIARNLSRSLVIGPSLGLGGCGPTHLGDDLDLARDLDVTLGGLLRTTGQADNIVVARTVVPSTIVEKELVTLVVPLHVPDLAAGRVVVRRVQGHGLLDDHRLHSRLLALGEAVGVDVDEQGGVRLDSDASDGRGLNLGVTYRHSRRGVGNARGRSHERESCCDHDDRDDEVWNALHVDPSSGVSFAGNIPV